ncbi:MAG: hypothetical protein RQ899_10555 [Pseudomonadales bacterium]|nr:hypothetical protein [Pseudomonadales bacterium]
MIDILIATVELFEAEGRALRRATVRVGWMLAMIALAGFFAIVAAALILWAFYQYLLTAMSVATAALLTGMLSLVFLGILLWLVNRLKR